MIRHVHVSWDPERSTPLSGRPTGPGVWSHEPDYVQCLLDHGWFMFVRRSPFSGAFNGYVAVPSKHPWNNQPYRALDAVRVHGGVTYSGPAANVGGSEENWGGLWAVGFDCAHGGDQTPKFPYLWGYYWTVNDVLHETLWLAVQAMNAYGLGVVRQEAEYRCRVLRPDGKPEWVWEKPIRQADPLRRTEER